MNVLPVIALIRLELDTTPIKRKGELVQAKYPRYEAVKIAGDWSGVEKLKNSKGKIRITKLPGEQVESRKAEAPEYFLQVRPQGCNAFNLSGLRFAFTPQLNVMYASGEPYHKAEFANTKNPLFAEYQQGHRYLFVKPVVSDEAEPWIEWLIIKGDDIDAWRSRLANGSYQQQLEAMRQVALPI